MNPSESPSSVKDSSCYYPGCKKNANCDCDICLASINATLDLIPFPTTRTSSFPKKLSSSRLKFDSSSNSSSITPLSFDPSLISTPISTAISTSRPSIETPALKSTSRALNLNHTKKEKNKEKERNQIYASASRGNLILLKFGVIGFILILAAEEAMFSSMPVQPTLQPVFTADSVMAAGERSWIVKGDLAGRVMLVQNQLRAFAPHLKVSNCSYKDSVWQINQDGLLLRSECVLYKSGTEEVKIWGWPFQTAGLIKAGFSSRSFTVLSGRLTEWGDGKIGYEVRRVNTSWVQQKWKASAVQMDPNTWVLEYSRSWMVDKPRLSWGLAELVKTRVSRLSERTSRVVLCSFSALKRNRQTMIKPT